MTVNDRALKELITRHGASVTRTGDRRPLRALTATAALAARRAGDELRIQPASLGLMVITVAKDAGSIALNAVHDATDDDPILFDAAPSGERRLWYHRGEPPEPDGCWAAGRTIGARGSCDLPNPERLLGALGKRPGRRPTTAARLPDWKPTS